MLCRLTRSLAILSPHLQRQKQLITNPKFVRLMCQTPVLNEAKKAENTDDLLFDLGGMTKNIEKESKKQEKSAAKVKKPKNEEIISPSTEKAAEKPIAKRSKPKRKVKIPDEKKDRSFEQLKYHDPALDLTYVKLPFGHPEFQSIMLMLKSRKYRETKNLLLVEGRRLTLEAIEAGLKMRYLMFSNVKQIETVKDCIKPSLTNKTEIIRVPHNDLSYWSTLTTCPGLITIFEKPKDMSKIWKNVKTSTNEKRKQNEEQIQRQEEPVDDEESIIPKLTLDSIPITVICDQVREPNNLGSIIRTCAALPCAQVVLMKGCADPWDVKALRGGCGSQFRVPVIGPIEWENLTTHLPNIQDVSVFIADNQSEQSDTTMPRDEFEQKRKENNSKYFRPKVYSDVPFHNCKHIVLVIGGETEGVSSHALDFMHFVTKNTNQTAKRSNENTNEDTNENTNENTNQITNANENVRPDNSILEIPLGNGVESLNASVATAILLFEMRKQLMQ